MILQYRKKRLQMRNLKHPQRGRIVPSRGTRRGLDALKTSDADSLCIVYNTIHENPSITLINIVLLYSIVILCFVCHVITRSWKDIMTLRLVIFEVHQFLFIKNLF